MSKGVIYDNQNPYKKKSVDSPKKEIRKRKMNEEKIKKKKLEEELSRAQVKDHLKCYICLNNIIKPRMCKFCKKLVCEECLKNWLKTKEICAFCKREITFDDTIYLPIIDELSNFFIKEAEKEPIKEESYNSVLSQSVNISIQNENICNEHHRPYEYYCIQCNKNYCPECLAFFKMSSKVHENHSIISLNLLENKDIKETVDEFKKLYISKTNLEDLIKLCNLKIREMEIEKNQYLTNLDIIKKNITDKIDHKTFSLKNKYENIKLKDEDITRATETTPIALQNIVKSKDFGQGEKIYEHLKNINRSLKNSEFNNNMIYNNIKIKNNFIESFNSELFEFILPDNGNYVEKKEIFNKKMDNFIPENECQIILKYENNNICFSIQIISKNKNSLVNYYGFIIIRNQKYDCEFVVIEDKSVYGKNILSSQFSSSHFISFRDENNKIRFRLYIMKLEKK